MVLYAGKRLGARNPSLLAVKARILIRVLCVQKRSLIFGAVCVMCAAAMFKWLSGSGSWDTSRFPSPWSDGTPIYKHVKTHLDSTSGLLAGGEELPDEARISTGSSVRWAPGALDAVFGHHMSSSDQKKAVQTALKRLEAALKRPDEARLTEFYRGLLEDSVLSYIDPFLEAIVEKGTLPRDRVGDLARWIATNAPDREPVKLAIALLGVSGAEDDAELLLTLGRHDEFTLYAAVALANTQPHAEGLLWELAKNVDDWGRVHIVERLGGTQDPEIRDWLLREGYKNSIMYEYTAFTCARAGELATALAADDIDRELFDGAGEIIQTLINGQGGPAEGIDDYVDGPAAVVRYLDHALRRDPGIPHLTYVSAIRRFLRDEEADWTSEARARWQDNRERLEAACTEFIERASWGEKVTRALTEADGQEFHTAAEAARGIGVDSWNAYFDRLQKGEDHWYFVMQTDDPTRIDRVVEHALSTIDLNAIATGPAEEMGMGLQWAEHGKLDFVLQDLRRFPGKGWPLIRAGLRSPLIRNRNMALRAIAAWDPDTWTDEIRSALESVEAAEPSDDVRELIQKVRSGEPLGF